MRTSIAIGKVFSLALLAAVAAGPGEAQTAAQVRVPQVVGRGDVFSAYDVLRAAGFRVATATSFSARSLCNPIVVRQHPRRGSRARDGSVVTITPGNCFIGSSAVPRQMPKAVVPSFAGKSPSGVTAWAERHRLYWDIEKIPPLPASSARHLLDNFRVTRQQPASGSTLRLGVITHGSSGRGFRPTPVTVWVDHR